jgi:hypothetical protein
MTFLPLDRTCFRLDLDLFVTTKHTSSRRLIASDLFAVTFAFLLRQDILIVVIPGCAGLLI